VLELLLVFVVELLRIGIGHVGFVADLFLHPLLLLHHAFHRFAERVLRLAGFLHLGFEDFLAGKLSLHAADFRLEIGILDFDRGGFARHEFVDDQLVEDFPVAGHFLRGFDVVGIDPRGGKGVVECFLEIRAGNFFAFDDGYGVGQLLLRFLRRGFVFLGCRRQRQKCEGEKAGEAAEVQFHRKG